MTEETAKATAEYFEKLAVGEENHAKYIGMDTWMGKDAVERAEKYRHAKKALIAYPAYKNLSKRLYPLDTEQDKNLFAVCPVCGQRIRETDKYCCACGQRVRYVSEIEWAERKALQAMDPEPREPEAPKPKKGGRKKGRLVCVETLEAYDTIKEAAEAHGLHVQTLQKHMSGYFESAGGYHWEWRDM